ncbi:MAG TPA: hypothetical protein VFH06_04330 [Candidatus Saccharimonadales bacterium]|nr:hypothetical protein [Candidatus Saccharimonadales bacterium]
MPGLEEEFLRALASLVLREASVLRSAGGRADLGSSRAENLLRTGHAFASRLLGVVQGAGQVDLAAHTLTGLGAALGTAGVDNAGNSQATDDDSLLVHLHENLPLGKGVDSTLIL